MGGSLGSSINISTNAGAQLASDLGKGLIQGTSQYLSLIHILNKVLSDGLFPPGSAVPPVRRVPFPYVSRL